MKEQYVRFFRKPASVTGLQNDTQIIKAAPFSVVREIIDLKARER